MTVTKIGEETFHDYISLERTPHGHDAEDVVDQGKLDLSNAEFDTVTVTSGAQLKLDSALAFTPADSNGNQISGAEYRFGRQENFGDTTEGLLDGINFKHQLQNEDQKISIQLHPNAPSIDIEGTKHTDVDWISIKDSSTNNTVFAVHDDGTIESSGWVQGSLPDGYHDALAVEGNSIYVGGTKLSEANGKLHVSHLKSPPHIPVRLTQSPYSFTSSNINANVERSINDWLILARSVLSESAGKSVRIRDVFTSANASTDFEDSGLAHIHDVTENVQSAINEFRSNANRLPDEYYFDSSFIGTPDGSKSSPYNNLSSFVSVILNSTPRKIFIHMKGDFSIDNLTIDHSDWDITILGNSHTTICSSSNNISVYGFKVNSCERFEIRDLELNTFLYGIRTYSGEEIIIHNIKCIKCGSDGSIDNHDGTVTQTELATRFSAGEKLSDGGGLRIKSSSGGTIKITNCDLNYCLRGIRVESCSKGIVYNNKLTNISDNGIYLRSCSNVTASNNCIQNIGHVGMQTIHTYNSVFKSNSVRTTWGNAFTDYGSLNTTIVGNSFANCLIETFNGYGVNGDHQAQYSFRATKSGGLPSGSFIAKTLNNNHTQAKLVTNVILYFEDGLKSSYSGCDLLYFENQYENNMTKTLGNDNWTVTSLNQEGSSLVAGAISETDKVVYSQNIKSYVDQEVAGAGSSNAYLLGFGDTSSITISENSGQVWVYKSKNQGGSHQSHARTINLPSNPESGFSVFIQCYDKISDPDDLPNQNVYISVISPNGDNTFKNHPLANEFTLHTDGNGDRTELRIYNCARKMYHILFEDDGYMFTVVGSLTLDQHTLLNNSKKWFHFESGTSTAYGREQVDDNYVFNTGGSASIFTIPSGYREYEIRYGHDVETWASGGFGGTGGFCFRLPKDNLLDGTTVSIFSGRHDTANMIETKKNANVIFDTVDGTPAARRLQCCSITQGDYANLADVDDPDDSLTVRADGSTYPFVASQQQTHRNYWRITYVLSQDIWIMNKIGN